MCCACLQVDDALLETKINGHTYHDLLKMGVLYKDAFNRVMVPPVMWQAVLGKYQWSVFGVDSDFGVWHDGSVSGTLLETQGLYAITARGNIPFARWVARVINKEATINHKKPNDSRRDLLAKAHSVRVTAVCCLLLALMCACDRCRGCSTSLATRMISRLSSLSRRCCQSALS